MKKQYITIILSLISIVIFSQNNAKITIGDQIPSIHHTSINVDDKYYSLNNLTGENGTVIIFSSNTCPFVIMWEDRYKTIEEICKKENFGMIYINSNHAKRDGDDSFLNMKSHALNSNYTFPYLLDKNSYLANQFGAKTTPHVFLFNEEKKLIYSGAIDDNYRSKNNVKQFYLKDAIISSVNRQEIKNTKTKAIGCSIKRKAH